MVENLEANLIEFNQYSQVIDKKFLKFLNRIRFNGNNSSHTIEHSVTTGYLNNLKEPINHNLKLLFRVIL